MYLSSKIKSDKIQGHLNFLTSDSDSLVHVNMWQLKRDICQDKYADKPSAKYDTEGNLVTNKNDLLRLYVNTYKNRLAHRTMEEGYEDLQNLKTFLFNTRMDLSKNRKSSPWTEVELLKVLKSLKSRKCIDPIGMNYELFKPGVIGTYLFKSLLMFCNETKERGEVIDILMKADITSIYKKKGSRLSLDNERGIFSVVKLKSLIDKLLYNDVYPIIDDAMSDSNVGARKQRNIRDNLFVVYAVINDAKDRGVCIDIMLMDLVKCFDGMWWEETRNDIWGRASATTNSSSSMK